MGNIKKIKNLNVEATSGKVAFSLFKLLLLSCFPWYVTRSPFVKHVETKYHITIFYLAPNSIDMNDMIHTSNHTKEYYLCDY